MALSDGWVGERVSADHTVIPDLSESRQSLVIEMDPEPDFEAGPAEEGVESRSGLSRVLVGAAVLVLLGVGGLFGWPLVADLLAEPEQETPRLALSSEPTQRLVIADGKIYLEGSVPDASVSDRIQQAAQQALGADRVVNNLEVSDDAFFDPSLPVELSVADTVLFPTGIASVSEEYRPLIDLAVRLMTAQPTAELTLIGHTDDRGPEDVNQTLSVERAQAVATELQTRGVDADRLWVEGRGETQPIAANDTPEGRSSNRRVEFLMAGLLD